MKKRTSKVGTKAPFALKGARKGVKSGPKRRRGDTDHDGDGRGRRDRDHDGD